jgi:peptidoglycan/LPS O-acetylase OafA/YrhL
VAWLIKGRILRFNAFSDVSYGLYIYAFPVQQTTTWLLGPMTPTQNVAIALPVTLALAALSWRLVEKPGLDRRRALARMLAWAAELPRRRRS